MDLDKLDFVEITRDKENSQIIKKVEIKHPPKVCEDCGDVVVDRRVTLAFRQTPIPHTRTSCSICGNFKNPETGVFDLSRGELDAIYYEKKRKTNK